MICYEIDDSQRSFHSSYFIIRLNAYQFHSIFIQLQVIKHLNFKTHEIVLPTNYLTHVGKRDPKKFSKENIRINIP